MARKRMIDPGFWRDEKIKKCTYMERLLFQGLWTFAEDSGVGRANPLLIKADIFPYDTLREADIQKSLDKLASLKLIELYIVDGQSYYSVINFKKHQTINRPSKCFLPEPGEATHETLTEHSRSTHGALTTEEKLKEEKRKEGGNASLHTLHGEFSNVRMKPGEYDKLISKYPKALVEDKIAYLDAQIQSGVKKYKSYKDHYATIGNWCRVDNEGKAQQESARDPKKNGGLFTA